MDLTTTKTFLLDGDGVLWHGDRPAPGLNRFFEQLARNGIRWGLLTNNSTRDADFLVQKFKGFGIKVGAESIFTSSAATAGYLRHHFSAGERVYVVGEAGIQQTVERAGFRVDTTLDENVEAAAVIVSLDRAFTYDKLKQAMRLILGGAVFIATNPDSSFPGPHGLTPGAGSIVAAVTTASGVQPEIMGKPGAPLFELAMEQMGASAATTVMVGDRLDTDILGAQRLGLGTILVLSGVSQREDIARQDIHPDIVCADIDALADEIERLAV